MSGDAGRGEDALAAGADAFRAKPLDPAGHLQALLGLDAGHARSLRPRHPPQGGAGAEGADPMALHDDLKRAHDLLHAGGPVGYAGQFVGGIARLLDDAPLVAAAELARVRGRRRPLMDALAARVAAGPKI